MVVRFRKKAQREIKGSLHTRETYAPRAHCVVHRTHRAYVSLDTHFSTWKLITPDDTTLWSSKYRKPQTNSTTPVPCFTIAASQSFSSEIPI